MTDSKKKRLSMLDSLASVGATLPTGSMMNTNRALRSARDAVDAHQVWDLDPADVRDSRPSDRIDPTDVADLRASIEANGQSVPILVRRDPAADGKYLLVYGRRRLEAIRGSEKVRTIRALIASLDDTAALRLQITENTGRHDLSYIERALFAADLMEQGFGTQTQVAEVLNTTKSAISMAVAVAKTVGADLIRAIGPARGIGRPKWESLAQALEKGGADRAELVAEAAAARAMPAEDGVDPSVRAFDLVLRRVSKALTTHMPATTARKEPLVVDGRKIGRLETSPKGVRLEVAADTEGFAAWFEAEAPSIIRDAHARWKSRG